MRSRLLRRWPHSSDRSRRGGAASNPGRTEVRGTRGAIGARMRNAIRKKTSLRGREHAIRNRPSLRLEDHAFGRYAERVLALDRAEVVPTLQSLNGATVKL